MWSLNTKCSQGLDYHVTSFHICGHNLYQLFNTDMKQIYLALLFAAVSLWISPSQAQLITNGLQAYYPLNGDANDHSGNGNDLATIGVQQDIDRFGNPNGCYQLVSKASKMYKESRCHWDQETGRMYTVKVLK